MLTGHVIGNGFRQGHVTLDNVVKRMRRMTLTNYDPSGPEILIATYRCNRLFEIVRIFSKRSQSLYQIHYMNFVVFRSFVRFRQKCRTVLLKVTERQKNQKL